jgi:hypothetical protein
MTFSLSWSSCAPSRIRNLTAASKHVERLQFKAERVVTELVFRSDGHVKD